MSDVIRIIIGLACVVCTFLSVVISYYLYRRNEKKQRDTDAEVSATRSTARDLMLAHGYDREEVERYFGVEPRSHRPTQTQLALTARETDLRAREMGRRLPEEKPKPEPPKPEGVDEIDDWRFLKDMEDP